MKKPVRSRVDNQELYPYIKTEDGYIKIKIKKHNEENGYKWEEIARAIWIKEVQENIDTGEIFFVLTFYYQGQLKEVKIRREDVFGGSLSQLVKLGADVFPSNIINVQKALSNQERSGTVSNARIHTGLGFAEFDEKIVFRTHNAIGVDSKYAGDLDIMPRGSLDEYKKMLNEQVVGYPPLELMFILGLSSILVGYVGKETDVGVLFVHINADSTTGKTTSSGLAISAAGNPSLKTQGLMKTWNGTQNAILKSFNNNNGLPVVLDEISMSRAKDFTEFVYVLAGGREKARLNENSDLKDVSCWNTTIISNGEFSITKKSKENTGILMRVLELSNLEFTKSADNAEAIAECIAKNHGLVAPIFAEYILKSGKENILVMFDKWRVNVEKELSDVDKFAKRLSSKLALIMTCCEIACEVLEVNFSTDKIMEILIKNEVDNNGERDIYVKAYEYFFEKIEENRAKFITETQFKSAGRRNFDGEKNIVSYPPIIWGRTKTTTKLKRKKETDKFEFEENLTAKTEISIIKNCFNELMKQGGFEDPGTILRGWKKMGFLDTEKDKLYRKRRVDPNGTAVHVYVILGTTEICEDESKKPKAAVPKRKRKETKTTFEQMVDLDL